MADMNVTKSTVSLFGKTAMEATMKNNAMPTPTKPRIAEAARRCLPVVFSKFFSFYKKIIGDA